MAEYDTFRAIVRIYYPDNDTGTLAYGVGDFVPVSNVTAYGYLAAGYVQALAGAGGSYDPSAFSSSDFT